MGAWKDWEIGMVEDGHSRQEVRDAEQRIKGTPADPFVSRSQQRRHEWLVAERDRQELHCGERWSGYIFTLGPVVQTCTANNPCYTCQEGRKRGR